MTPRRDFRNLPLKWKLTTLSLLTCSVALAIAGSVFFIYDQVSFRADLIRRVTTMTRIVSYHSSAAVIFRDSKVAAKILAGFEEESDVLFAALYLPDGTALATYRHADIDDEFSPPSHPVAGYEIRKRYICVSHSVAVENEKVGSAVVCYSLLPLRERFYRYALVAMFVLITALMLSWILALYLQSKIVRPIRLLQDAANRICDEADLSIRAAQSPAGDEVGALIDTFNAMLAKLQGGDDELRSQQRKLRSLASQLVLTEERERRQIAADLHDSACQILWAASLKVNSMSRKPSPSPDDFRELNDLIRDAISETRSLIFELSPPELYQFGLRAALHKMAELLGSRLGLHVEFKESGADVNPGVDLSVLLYRAVRALLTNVHKHSGTKRAWIRIFGEPERFRITVSDEGKGFDAARPTEQDSEGGFGLFSIRERLVRMGGAMQIDSAPGEGTTVTLDAPVAEVADDLPERTAPTNEEFDFFGLYSNGTK